ncbi:MAG TPA: lipid biosynthesis B12-binding/radical SAM protein [Verrucomicrobiae bacterium]|nr:lipid biosynthesis B12-binding/radical SAM protein [Verrucomicrobiae bacterium]
MAGRSRILLVSVNTEDQPYPVYPLALDYLRAPLQQAGHETRTWDARQGVDLGRLVQDYRPDVALVSIRNADNNDAVNIKNYLPGALAVVGAIKDHSAATVVLGGSGYSLFPEEILRGSRADFGVAGAGEHVVVPLIEHLLAGTDPRALPGLVHRDGSNPPDPPPGTAVLAREPELVRFYWAQGGIPGVQLKRGCPFECVYCTYPLLEGRKFLQKDAVAAVDEVQELYELAGVDQFFVVDSVMNAVPELARAFAEELRRRELPVRWSGYFLPRGITRADLELWKAAGLDGVEFGVDTLSPSLLKRWGKAFELAELREAVHACLAVGMPYSMYLILGGPGETEATLEQTIAEAQACPRAVVFAFVGMRIYPRTQLYDLARRESVIRDGESLLDPKFYISSLLNRDLLLARCHELGRQLNWLVVGPSLEKKSCAAARLRGRGRKGPLWQELIVP